MAKKDGAKGRQKPGRFEVEQTMSTSEVAGYLEGLARGLRDGTLVVGDEAQGFRTPVDGDVDLEVEARRGKRKSRLALSLAFRATTGSVAAPVEAANDGSKSKGPPRTTIPDEMSF